MMADADLQRQLKIKTGTVKRLRKELAMYEEEQKKEGEKVQKLKDEGADPHDIKYAVSRVDYLCPHSNLKHRQIFQEGILAESAAMVPDTRQRLGAAFAELQSLSDECLQSLEGTEELQLALEEVNATSAILL